MPPSIKSTRSSSGRGSFFEPVAGETFELVVCNPPYVISPESEYVFRDSGLGRDRVSERLVGELPGYLDEGGFGTIMVSWIQAGDDPAGRPTGRGSTGSGRATPGSFTQKSKIRSRWPPAGTADAGTGRGSFWRRHRSLDGIFRATKGSHTLAYGAILVLRR